MGTDVYAQQVTVHGTVTDAQTGNTLPGVNILVIGTTTGTATNNKGHYSINVPSLQDTLQFSFIGYETKTIPINGRTAIDVSLTPKVVSGQQMVVVGFQKTSVRSVTTSIASVSSKDIQDWTTGDVAIPGVYKNKIIHYFKPNIHFQV